MHALILLVFMWIAAFQPQEPTALLISGQDIYRVPFHQPAEKIWTLEANQDIVAYEDSLLWLSDGKLVDLSQPTPLVLELRPTPSPTFELPYTPHGTPQVINTPFYQLFSLTGADDNYTNLYFLEAGELLQLTDVTALFPEAQSPYLSASAQFISARDDGFMYRARVRDATGKDFNALYFHVIATGENAEMPYFGKNPVWSPDSYWLAGSRLNEEGPIYELWLHNFKSAAEINIAPGCNPQWSPDSEWIAYDLHENAKTEVYTDCFANGQVEAYHLDTEERLLLSAGIEGYVQLLGFIP